MTQRVSEDPTKDERPNRNYPLGEFDAEKWAAEFVRIWGDRLDEVDHGLMLTWFANAIMTGHDKAANDARSALAKCEADAAAMREALSLSLELPSPVPGVYDDWDAFAAARKLALSGTAGAALLKVAQAAVAWNDARCDDLNSGKPVDSRAARDALIDAVDEWKGGKG